MLARQRHQAVVVVPKRVLHTGYLKLRQHFPALLLVQCHAVLAAQQQPTRRPAEVHTVCARVWRGALLRHLVVEVLDQNLATTQKGFPTFYMACIIRGLRRICLSSNQTPRLIYLP